MARALIVVAFLAALGGALAYFVAAWSSIGSAHISAHGWLAIIGGAIATLALGGGLMALVFYSARQGYDDIDRRD
jgi:Ca2+/Na+ antiporter